jgi:hypothetical protein
MHDQYDEWVTAVRRTVGANLEKERCRLTDELRNLRAEILEFQRSSGLPERSENLQADLKVINQRLAAAQERLQQLMQQRRDELARQFEEAERATLAKQLDELLLAAEYCADIDGLAQLPLAALQAKLEPSLEEYKQVHHSSLRSRLEMALSKQSGKGELIEQSKANAARLKELNAGIEELLGQLRRNHEASASALDGLRQLSSLHAAQLADEFATKAADAQIERTWSVSVKLPSRPPKRSSS